MLQKQGHFSTPQTTWFLKTAYWFGYSIPLVVLGLIFWRYQAQISEGWSQGLAVLLYFLTTLLSPALGSVFARLTGHSQAQRCVETWRRTPRALPEFPRLVVLASARGRGAYYLRGFWICFVSTVGYLVYLYINQSEKSLRGLGLFVFSALVYLIYWYEKKSKPRELAWAGAEGIWADKWVPWEEIARVETDLRRNYLGEPEQLRLDLFDVSDRALGQVWVDCDGPKRPDASMLESFYETLRAEFELTSK
jgi:hypothetical protein